MDTKEFCNRHKVRASSDYVSENPNSPGWKDANHYKVTLRMSGKQLTTYFSMGYGLSGEPQAYDVLDCLASDSASVEYASSFEEWASDLGYDTDSRKAEGIYNTCVKQANKLKSFLGEELYNTLLWETERL